MRHPATARGYLNLPEQTGEQFKDGWFCSRDVFVRDAVEHLRAAGLEMRVVSPASFRHFGIAYGHGIAGNLRRKPWLALLLLPIALTDPRRWQSWT